MRKWINKLKRWVIHKLGGYTADEATPNRKIQRLSHQHIYSIDMVDTSLCDVHLRERANAMRAFVNCIPAFVKMEQHYNPNTRDWTIRTSLHVVDYDLL